MPSNTFRKPVHLRLHCSFICPAETQSDSVYLKWFLRGCKYFLGCPWVQKVCFYYCFLYNSSGMCVCVSCREDSTVPPISSQSDSSPTIPWQTTTGLFAQLLEYSWHLLLWVNSWDAEVTLNQFRFCRFQIFFLPSNVIFSQTKDSTSNSVVFMWKIFSFYWIVRVRHLRHICRMDEYLPVWTQ